MRRIHYRSLRFLIPLMLLISIIIIGSLFYASSRSESPQKPNPKILVWTKIFQGPPVLNDFCPLSTPCEFSTDHADFNTADAVVFHAHDIQRHDLPKSKSNWHQKYVFYSQEASPSLNKESRGTFWKDVLKFDWVMSYANTSHIRTPYGGYFVSPKLGKERNFKPIGNFVKDRVISEKTHKGAIWFVSNCEATERLNVANSLKRHFLVDIGGKCSPDKKDLCLPNSDCNSLISKYYFYLSFENANCKDYVTEKFTNMLELPVVPIVMKRSVYEGIFPSNAFIAVDDFPSAKELAKHLNYLIENSDEYFKLIEWRNEWKRADWNSAGYRLGLCALCEKLQNEANSVTQPIEDLKKWYDSNSQCSTAVSSEWYN